MKKTLVLILVVVMCLMATLPLSGCFFTDTIEDPNNPSQGGNNQNQGGNNQNPGGSSQHKHSYTSKVVPATCKEKQYTLYTCSCGDGYKEYTGSIFADHKGVGNCTDCGKNIYTILRDHIKKYGKFSSDGKYILDKSYDQGVMRLTYSSSNDYILLTYVFSVDGNVFGIGLTITKSSQSSLRWNSVGTVVGMDIEASGLVNPTTFTDSTKYLIESSTNAPSATLTSLRELNAGSLRTLLSLFDLYSIVNNLQISRSNFGFPAVK